MPEIIFDMPSSMSKKDAAKLEKKLRSKIKSKLTKKETAKKSISVSKKAKDGGNLRTLAPMAAEINVRLEKANQMDGKALDHRLAACIQLDVAKKFCEKTKINFKKWAEAKVDKSYDEIRKLATIGASSDPKQALEDMRSGNKKRNQKLRDKKVAAVKKSLKSTPETRAIEAFDVMDEKSAFNLIQEQAAKLGMVISALENDTRSMTPLQHMKDIWTSATPLEKAEFISWATELKIKASSGPLEEVPAFMDKRKAKAPKNVAA